MSARPTAPQRLAIASDAPQISALMRASILDLFPRFYDDRQVASAADHIGDLDTMLIEDGTYFVHEADREIVACGGWSRRDRLYTGSGDAADDARLLDPSTEPARVRAMFVRSDWTRRGLGRAILDSCARAAQDEGFTQLAPDGHPAGGAPLPGVRLPRGQADSGHDARRRIARGRGHGTARRGLGARQELVDRLGQATTLPRQWSLALVLHHQPAVRQATRVLLGRREWVGGVRAGAGAEGGVGFRPGVRPPPPGVRGARGGTPGGPPPTASGCSWRSIGGGPGPRPAPRNPPGRNPGSLASTNASTPPFRGGRAGGPHGPRLWAGPGKAGGDRNRGGHRAGRGGAKAMAVAASIELPTRTAWSSPRSSSTPARSSTRSG